MFKPVEVTQHDIRYGKQGDDEQCAVARSVRRTLFPRGFTVSVSASRVDVTHIKSGTEHSAKLPKAAKEFIELFDTEDGKKAVGPIHFRLSFPAKFLALAGH